MTEGVTQGQNQFETMKSVSEFGTVKSVKHTTFLIFEHAFKGNVVLHNSKGLFL